MLLRSLGRKEEFALNAYLLHTNRATLLRIIASDFGFTHSAFIFRRFHAAVDGLPDQQGWEAVRKLSRNMYTPSCMFGTKLTKFGLNLATESWSEGRLFGAKLKFIKKGVVGWAGRKTFRK